MSARPVVHLIAAARPNFMKVGPLYHALCRARFCDVRLVHTGQHYDDGMSGSFIRDLGLPSPHHHLGVGSGTHAEQTAGVMVAYERVCRVDHPQWTVVAGDVNSTIACALTATKIGVRVAHLEAGLRSGDRTMPEEINRVLTDAISDLLWTPSPDGDANLAREGVASHKIERIGNIMIDSYELMRPRVDAAPGAAALGLAPREYLVVTLHRPSNVDHRDALAPLVDVLMRLAARRPVVFPVHPRTRRCLETFGLHTGLASAIGMHLVPPLSYVEFMALVRQSAGVVTDSGGIQEETTYLGIPCLTLRDTTERPITVTEGTNRLGSPSRVEQDVQEMLDGKWPRGRRPDLWDGRAAERAAASLARVMSA